MASSSAERTRRNQRRSLDAYDAAFLEKDVDKSDKGIMDIFNVSTRKAKTPTSADIRIASKREKRQTFASGSTSGTTSGGSSSAPQLLSEVQNLNGSPSGLADLPDINIASMMVNKKKGGRSTRDIHTYKLKDILVSEEERKDAHLAVREHRHSDDTKPSNVGQLPNISPTECRKKIETEYECGGGNGTIKTKASFLMSMTSPNTPAGSGNSTPASSGKIVKSNSVLMRLKMSGGTIIAGPVAKDAIEGLGLQQKELKILKDAFDKMDVDKNSFITQSQLFGALKKMGYQQTSFATKVYELIDIEGSGSGNVEFGACVRLSGTFLMFTSADLLRFVFQCYQKKGDGMFGEQDFVDLTADINTTTIFGGPRRWVDVLKYDNFLGTLVTTVGAESSVDIPRKGYLIEEEFVQMSADYPQLMTFAVQLQTMLRQLCLGQRFYQKLLNRQQRARAVEEYKETHLGGIPKEEFSMNTWFRKVAHISHIDDEPELAKRDNSKLLEMGFPLYSKLLYASSSSKSMSTARASTGRYSD